MKNQTPSSLLRQKFYNPENLLCLKTTIYHQRQTSLNQTIFPVQKMTLQTPKTLYPSPNCFIKKQQVSGYIISNSTPKTKQRNLSTQSYKSNASLELSQTRNNIDDSTLSTIFNRSKVTVFSGQSSNKTFDMPLQCTNQKSFYSVDSNQVKENILFYDQFQDQGYNPNDKSNKKNSDKKPKFTLNTESQEKLTKTNRFHLNFRKDNRIPKTNKPSVLFQIQHQSVPNFQTDNNRSRNTSLYENTNQSEQSQLVDLIKQEPEMKTKRKILIQSNTEEILDEYSYRKVNTTVNDTIKSNMSFFRSQSLIQGEKNKARSFSLSSSVQTSKLKNLLNQVMENTHKFDDFLDSIPKKKYKNSN